MLLQRNDGLTFHESAFLWEHLVFEVQASDAGALVFTYRAADVDDVAVPGIRIGDDWNSRCAANMPKVLHHLSLGN